MGLVMVWMVPPFQKADEIIHLQFASSIVEGKPMVVQKRFVELAVRLKALEISHKFENKFDTKRVWEKDENKELLRFDYPTNWKSYISYFPVEVGVWLGSLSPYPVMALYLGRLAGLILFLICIWLSLIIIPKKYSGLILAYGVIPMVVHQATEVSYDVFLLCLAPLILAVFLRVLKYKNFWRWFGLLIFLTLLFVLAKSGYYLMLLLPLKVIWARYKNEIIDRPWIVGLLILMTIPLLLWTGNFLKSGAGGDVYQLQIIKRDPMQVWRILSDTWEAKRDFYIKGMFGYFGWLDYEFDLYQYLIIFGILVAILGNVISKIKKPMVDWLGWVMIGGIILGTYILIEMGFLMQWTVVGSTVVEGVQGRYLLPLVSLLFFWICQFWGLVGKKRANIIVFGLAIAILIWGMVDKINKRYFDFSANFNNKDEMQKETDKIKAEKRPITFVSSINKMTRYFHVANNDVIGGFEMVIKKPDDGLIKIPYRYSLKNKDCTNELRWGYLDVDSINKNEIYVQKMDELKIGDDNVCLEIEPLITNLKENYFNYWELDEEPPMARLLFISNETK